MPEHKSTWSHRPAWRLAWCALGIGAGLSLALAVVLPPASPLLFAPLGASSMFLFGLTSMPAAQPRALFGGHLGCAAIGIAAYQGLGDALWVYALAQALALVYMLGCRVMHPPAGANPALMIHGHAGLSVLWDPVLLGLLCLAAVAFVWSRLYPGLTRWPGRWWAPMPDGDRLGGGWRG